MKRKPSITIKEICAALPMSDKGVRKNINKLKEQGRLRRVGPDKAGSWQVTGWQKTVKTAKEKIFK